MKNKIYLLILLFFVFSYSYGQVHKFITANVSMEIEDGDFEDATLILKENNSGDYGIVQEKESYTNYNRSTNSYREGKKYVVRLSFNQKFTFVFHKPGYITKMVLIDTTVPDSDRIEQGFDSFFFTVVLIKQNDTTKNIMFTQPVTEIKYSAKFDDFNYSSNYNKVDNLSYNNGVKKSEQKDYSGAIKDFTDALNFNPKDTDALYNRGVMKFKLNDKEGACADWNSLKSIGSNVADELLKKYCSDK